MFQEDVNCAPVADSVVFIAEKPPIWNPGWGCQSASARVGLDLEASTAGGNWVGALTSEWRLKECCLLA